jgi:hypothetical protein
MRAAFKFARFTGIVVLCLGSLNLANAASSQRKPKKPVMPPLPSGPTGPVPQVPLDSIAPVPPQVSYQDGQLTIVAPNSTLGDILRAVRKQTGAEIEVPEAKERVVTRLGPGSAREVLAELLNGSRFNYVMLGSPMDANALTRVVLVPKPGPDNANASAMNQPAQSPISPAANMQPGQPQQTDDAEAEDSSDDSAADQAADADQPAAAPAEQPEVKTPQQMLQEMQQRQLQLQQQQQQQQPGMIPNPGPGVPVRPPQQEQQ